MYTFCEPVFGLFICLSSERFDSAGSGMRDMRRSGAAEARRTMYEHVGGVEMAV